MNETQRDLIEFDQARKIKRLSQLTALGGSAISGAMAFSGQRTPALATATLAGLVGLLAGKQKKLENEAMARLDRQHFNKQAMFSSFIPAFKGNLIPLAMDLASIPFLGAGLKGIARTIAHATAKKNLGQALTKAESFYEILGRIGKKGLVDIPSSERSRTFKEMFTRSPSKKLKKFLIGSYAAPFGAGAIAGESAADVISVVGKVSPKYKKLMTDAIAGGAREDLLRAHLKKDFKHLNTTYDILKNTQTGKVLLNEGATSGSNILKNLDTGKLPQFARDFAAKEKKVLEATKSLEDTYFGGYIKKKFMTGGESLAKMTPNKMMDTYVDAIEGYKKFEKNVATGIGMAGGAGAAATGLYYVGQLGAPDEPPSYNYYSEKAANFLPKPPKPPQVNNIEMPSDMEEPDIDTD